MTYPITTETHLSIDQTVKLLKALMDLLEPPIHEGDDPNEKVKLPRSLQKRVKKVLDAQKELVQEVDDYIHNGRRIE